MSLKIADLFSVSGKVVLVTGGSRGLGEIFARAYVENGAKVYISARKAEACDALAQELSAYGTCISLPADLSRMEEIERLAGELDAREEKLHILINNAGSSWSAKLDSFPEHGWDKVMNLNVKSVFFTTQKLMPLLAAAGTDDDWARVINIGSIEGLHVSELDAPSYSTSKAAVIHLSRVLAAKLAPSRIAVNAVAPGYFLSKLTEGLGEEYLNGVASASRMGRLGRPEDMAGIALYLGSRASGFVTGAVIPVDGGLATTA
ncbi:SDR family oxidoreductase [Pedomonas mirosovicensis]|uniref:SDR family oxidoreductase n=1 Tax=Pedomonas mirosovicensis TaxID=2908641 RepID=UPI002167A89A|nr:SDR family oxidoreductase [Pedomonas mirosovicensis]MCH8684879.1 SDR family oxidoreductase [Pedomonas mirosovicensis]